MPVPAAASPPVLSPMLAGGNGVPADPSAYQFEPKFDGLSEENEQLRRAAVTGPLVGIPKAGKAGP